MVGRKPVVTLIFRVAKLQVPGRASLQQDTKISAKNRFVVVVFVVTS
jgi:hypothetical protein